MEYTPQQAAIHKASEVKLLSVEFPGHVKNIEKVKEALGGEQAIRNAYAGGAQLDLRYRIGDPFSIPIQGETINTPNFLLKATRRYKVKRPPGGGTQRSLPPYRAPTADDIPYYEDEEPEYKFEMVGKIVRTVRFPGLADYQHIVDPKDEFVRIKNDLRNIDYEHLISVKVDNKNPIEDYSTMQLIPPTIISKATVPIAYRYKARDEDAVKRKGGKKRRRPIVKDGEAEPESEDGDL
ncbi:tau 95 subunit of transcription factor TFIIIC [Mortierella sp. GBA35]|nr:tau 95 subunit of transcription factor TFIIIC [Mortierella sp. AD031]KAF9106219.1 tau 95 subunit of transcription factor TFIIIC [Mortierella sp. GBA35]KAG0218345.1 tau 95 subunit of transcription factor TFIIIC [Mortierella sp. NVP41]